MILEHCHKESCTQIIESLQRELAQAKELLANQKELIMYLYTQVDKKGVK